METMYHSHGWKIYAEMEGGMGNGRSQMEKWRREAEAAGGRSMQVSKS
jgi:hypothetical protein